jgi:endonuclease YncB( thermonuclease family)
MKTFALAAAMLLAVFVSDALTATLAGRVVGISEGDTVTVLTAENRQFRIRLSGIDVPEKKQPFGVHAKETLARQRYGQTVVVEWSKTDRYGRILGKIEVDGVDANPTGAGRFGMGVHAIPARTAGRRPQALPGSGAAGKKRAPRPVARQ